jgi:hypothetical protein
VTGGPPSTGRSAVPPSSPAGRRTPGLSLSSFQPCPTRPADQLFPCPAGDRIRGWGGPERRRSARPEVTQTPMLTELLTRRSASRQDRAVRAGTGRQRTPCSRMPQWTWSYEARRAWRDCGPCARRAASPLGLLPTMQWSPRTGLALQASWSRHRQARAPSFSPAVPPTCHKERSGAGSRGQPRSIRGRR